MSYGQPTPPSPGYELLPQLPSIPYNADLDARALRKAMKGFGTDEKTLIDVLHNKGPLQIEVLRETFFNMFKRRLLADVESETSSWFREGLAAIIRGPLLQDCHLLYNAVDGLGTKESLLNEVLLGRSNADIRAIKTTYEKRYRRKLVNDIKGDLSADTEKHFLMVLEANRNEDSAPVIPQEVDRDVATLWGATEAIRGKQRMTVCEIFTKRNDNQLRAIAHTYQQKHGKPLEWVIKKVRSFPSVARNCLLISTRNSRVTWKTPFYINLEPLWIRLCVMLIFSKHP
jgi:annexin A7/11